MANKYPLILDGSQIRELPDSSGISIGSSSTITDTKVGQWETAYGWGNHASGGYAQADSVNTSALVGNISASSLSGTLDSASFPSVLPAVNGSLLTNVSAGKILQVVQYFDDAYAQTGSSGGTTWYDVISGSITPSSTSSKILITGHITTGQNTAYGAAVRIILNGSTDIGTAAAGGLANRLKGHSVGTHGSNTHDCTTYPITYLHSPSTTSSTSYKLQVGARDQAEWAKNGPWDNNDSTMWYRAQGTTCLQLWEIAG